MNALVDIDTDHPTFKLSPMSANQRRVATLLAYGFTPPEIADHIDLTEMTVRKLAKDPKTDEMITHLAELSRKTCMGWKENFDFLMGRAIKTYEKVLQAPDDDPKVSMDLKVRVASSVMDRHPDSTFIKASKQKMETKIGLDSDALDELRRRALLTNAEIIDLPAPLESIPCAVGEESVSLHSLPPEAAEVVE